MLKSLKKRLKSDRGDSELISLILLLPLVLGLLLTMIDTSVYFSNKSVVQSIARDGARTVAIYGGNGNGGSQTAIERQYGQSKATACAGLSTNAVVKAAYNPATSTAIECNMMQTLGTSPSLVNVNVSQVSCSPDISNSIGQRTSCSVIWAYGSIPGSALTLLKGTDSSGKVDVNKPGLVGTNTTVGTSESEVDLTGTSLVPRS